MRKKIWVGGIFTAVLAVLMALALPAVAVTNTSLMLSSWTPNDSGQSSGLELGVRLTSSANGFVTEIKYYKYASSTTSHEGHIWDANGTLLATVPFTNETASGWQTATLSSPVAISANSDFTVSVFSTDYHYPDDGFPSMTAGPLTIQNGYYLYGSSSGFPNQTVGKNYAVDLTFADSLSSSSPSSSPSASSSSNAQGSVGSSSGASATALATTGNATMGSVVAVSVAIFAALFGGALVNLSLVARRRRRAGR